MGSATSWRWEINRPFNVSESEIPRLRRKLAWSFGTAWALGLGLLLAVALWEGLSRLSEEVDRELQVRTSVVYGLAWFNGKGDLDSTLLEREPIAHDAEFPIRIFSETSGAEPVFGPELSAAMSESLRRPIHEVLTQQRDSWSGDIGSERIYLLPMYPDNSNTPVGIASVAHGISSLGAQQFRFVALLGGTFIVLAGLGVVVALRLARSSVQPISAMLNDRERFVAGAAHELRTPLAAILAVSESGEAGDEPPPAALERVTRIAKAAERKAEALLAYARLESGTQEVNFERARVDLVVERAVEPYPHAVLDLHEVVARIDVALFEVAVENLLANAARHGDGGGGRGVTITLRDGLLNVEDRGPGFPSSRTGNGAPPFGWSSSPERGHGIGLTLAARIATLHGGILRLDNGTEGAIASFSFR